LRTDRELRQETKENPVKVANESYYAYDLTLKGQKKKNQSIWWTWQKEEVECNLNLNHRN